MIQLSNKCSMFAAVQTKNYRTYMLCGFFMSVLTGLYLHNDIRLFKSRAYPYSDMSMVLGRTWEANSLSYIHTFQISRAMTKNGEFCNAANNSTCTATSAHETCILSLTGNPFRDIASYGFDLHRCKINYNQSQNANGHSITGVFNISGRTLTAGANSYAELIETVVRLRREYQQYVSLCQKNKRERYESNRLRRMTAEA